MIQAEQEEEFHMFTRFLSDTRVGDYAALFGAEYVRHARTESRDYWHICWEDRIVNLTATWFLTDDQVAAVAEILRP